jgi:hypothetical protein
VKVTVGSTLRVHHSPSPLGRHCIPPELQLQQVAHSVSHSACGLASGAGAVSRRSAQVMTRSPLRGPGQMADSGCKREYRGLTDSELWWDTIVIPGPFKLGFNHDDRSCQWANSALSEPLQVDSLWKRWFRRQRLHAHAPEVVHLPVLGHAFRRVIGVMA